VSDVEATVRAVLATHARLSVDAHTLPSEADLFQAGMTSQTSVNVMLGLEDAFGVEFPDSMLNRSSFESIAAIDGRLRQLTSEAA